MKRLRTIVVEDERLPRLSLLKKLEQFRQQVEVVDSLDNYDDALRSILHHQPDLLLLDIQLQGHDALQLLDAVKEANMPLPHIIFTTAYNERRYLLQAIKLQAVDYLLKPIDTTELAQALAKVTAGNAADRRATVAEAPKGRLALRTPTGRILVDPDDIAFIQADGNYVNLTTFHDQALVLENLTTMEQHLHGDGRFMRVGRSTIVNLQNITKMNTQQHSCKLRSADGQEKELKLSKAAFDMLYRMF